MLKFRVIGTFFSSAIQCHGRPNQNQKSLDWFTTRANGLKREKYSKVPHISMFSSWGEHAQENEGDLVSMETKQGNRVNQAECVCLRKLEGTLVIVMSFHSRMEIHIPLCSYIYISSRDEHSIGDKDVWRWRIMYTCYCVVLECCDQHFPWWHSFSLCFNGWPSLSSKWHEVFF